MQALRLDEQRRLPVTVIAFILKTAVEARGIRQLAERQAVVRKAVVTGTVTCEAVDFRYRSLTFAARYRAHSTEPRG